MISDVAKQLDDWRRDSLPTWADHRVADPEFLDVWVWFCKHLYAEFPDCGFAYRGASFKEEGDGTLLVLKITRNAIQEVVFVTAADTTSCVRKLRRLLRAGEARFYVDRYA